MKWFLSRLAEPSTWAGLALLAQGAAVVFADPRNPQAWANAIGGVLAVVAREKGVSGA